MEGVCPHWTANRSGKEQRNIKNIAKRGELEARVRSKHSAGESSRLSPVCVKRIGVLQIELKQGAVNLSLT